MLPTSGQGACGEWNCCCCCLPFSFFLPHPCIKSKTPSKAWLVSSTDLLFLLPLFLLFDLLTFTFFVFPPCLHTCICMPSPHFFLRSDVIIFVLGAINAMQDATILANCLYDLEDLSPESILKTFRDYRDQRYTYAKKQVANSQLNAKISSGQVQFPRMLSLVCTHALIGFFSRLLRLLLPFPFSISLHLFVCSTRIAFFSLLFFLSPSLFSFPSCLSTWWSLLIDMCPISTNRNHPIDSLFMIVYVAHPFFPTIAWRVDIEGEGHPSCCPQILATMGL